MAITLIRSKAARLLSVVDVKEHSVPRTTPENTEQRIHEVLLVR